MKKETMIVGVGTDGTAFVVNGAFIFQLIDSIGLPFDIIVQECKERQIAFDLLDFIRAARDSKNYTPKRLKALLNENRPTNDAGFDEMVDFTIRKVYSEGI